MISVYANLPELECTPRRIELLKDYNKLIKFGRENPVEFAEKVWGIRLTDYQKYAIMGAWTANTVTFLMARNSGKSFLASIYLALRCTLFANTKAYIVAKSSAQANETFSKFSDLCLGKVTTLKYQPDAIYAEIVKPPNSNGFVASGDCMRCDFYNGSFIMSLPGNPATIRGKRADLVIFDEAAFIGQDVFSAADHFTAQDANFVMAQKGIDVSVLPDMLPKQNIYMSSAGEINTKMWEVYKLCATNMLLGDKDYFVCDFNYTIPANPTLDGKPYKPLLSQKKIDAARENPYEFEREFLNLFNVSGSDDAVVKNDAILRNEKVYRPVLETQNREDVIYGIFHDSAAQYDNSFVLIGEFYRDKQNGWMARLINGINLLDYTTNGGKDKKRVMTTDKQIEWLRKLMVAYNGNFPEYNKIHLFMDPGGLGVPISDFIIKDWTDQYGVFHHGVIDMEYDHSASLKTSYPTAVEGVLQMLNAKKYKTLMYSATAEMINRDLITFPIALPSNRKMEIDGKIINLTKEEQRAMIELDMTKTEFLTMRKTTSPKTGETIYALAPEMTRKMHDDRAYCLAALGYFLSELRHKDDLKDGGNKQDLSALYGRNKATAPKKISQNPFVGKRNPFSR